MRQSRDKDRYIKEEMACWRNSTQRSINLFMMEMTLPALLCWGEKGRMGV